MYRILLRSSDPRTLPEEVKLLYANAYGGAAATVVAAIVLPLILWDTAPRTFLVVWMALNLLFSVIQLVAIRIYLARFNSIARHLMWARIYMAWSAMFGMLIGSAGLLTVPLYDDIFIFFVMGAMAAGSIGTMSVRMESFVVFSAAVLFPVSIKFILSGHANAVTMGIVGIFFFLIMLMTARRMNLSTKVSLQLKYEKEEMIAELRKSEEKFFKAFQTNALMMAITSADEGVILEVNQGLLDNIGYTRQEVVGRTINELGLFADIGNRDLLARQIKESKQVRDFDLSYRTKKGETRSGIASVSRITIQKRPCYIYTINDITSRKIMEDDLVRARDSAESATRAKSNFLAKMSHEIRTPMNAIIGMANLALMTGDDEERIEYLNTIREASDVLLTVINDILDFSKIEAGKVSLEIRPFNLHETLSRSVRTFEYKAQEKGLYIKLEKDPSVPEEFTGDQTRLVQILNNIISNAVKFTHHGGITVRAGYNDGGPDTAGDRGAGVLITVSDTGIGIPADRQKAIFESFTQAEVSITRRYGGTGLGLAICRELLDMMGGTIRVESVEGKGSVFYIAVPIKNIGDTASGPKSRSADECVVEMKPLSILLAEDNRVNAKLAEVVLKKLGHSVDVVVDGMEVLDRLRVTSYDLIIMDIEMPRMNGIETTQCIRNGLTGEKNARVPIIAMTAHVMDDVLDESRRAGMDHIISKPLSITELGPVISDIVRASLAKREVGDEQAS